MSDKSGGPRDFDVDAEFLLKGLVDHSRRFFQELIESNTALRRLVASQEERLGRAAEEAATARRRADGAEALQRENEDLMRELARLKERFSEIEFEQQDFSERYRQIEEQYAVVANLYVASYQLHATVAYAEVLAAAKEIIANLVGVRRMRLYLRNRKNQMLIAAELDVPKMSGPHEGTIDPHALEDPRLADALAGGNSYHRPQGQDTGVIAVIPLRIRKTVVGMIVVDELLPQKDGLTAADEQMFELLKGHLAVAIARAVRKPDDGRAPTLADQEFDFSSILLVV